MIEYTCLEKQLVENGILDSTQESESDSSAAKNLTIGDKSLVDNYREVARSTGFYYDHYQSKFLMKDATGRWIYVTEAAVKRKLRAMGYSSKTPKNGLISAADLLLAAIQEENAVAWSGPLAGYKMGIHQMLNKRIIVTEEADLIDPRVMEWPNLNTFLNSLLGPVQRVYFDGWLKIALQSLYTGNFRQGQCLILAGPPNSGKSFCQTFIITALLGGRVERPHGFMTGRSNFNGELFGAEHLVMEDEMPSTDIRARRQFGAQIKSFVVNKTSSLHAKHKQALTMCPFWRLSISVNDSDEHLLVLPPMDQSQRWARNFGHSAARLS